MRPLLMLGLLLSSLLSDASDLFPVDVDPWVSGSIWDAIIDQRFEQYGRHLEIELRHVDRYPVPAGGCSSLEGVDGFASVKELLWSVQASRKCGLIVVIGSPSSSQSYRLEEIDGVWAVTKTWSRRSACR